MIFSLKPPFEPRGYTGVATRAHGGIGAEGCRVGIRVAGAEPAGIVEGKIVGFRLRHSLKPIH